VIVEAYTCAGGREGTAMIAVACPRFFNPVLSAFVLPAITPATQALPARVMLVKHEFIPLLCH
jgi:hypothetical protein